MTMIEVSDRATVGDGAVAEYEAFADLLESLDDPAWRAPSRCTGFDVRDVAGHVVGLAEDVAKGVPGSRTAEEEAATVRDDAPAAAAARLRTAVGALRALLEVVDDDAWNGPSPVPDLTLGAGVLTLWYDTYVHADDIRAATGRPSERGRGLDAAVAYLANELTNRGWGPATLALDGVDKYAVGGGDGPTVTGDALQFVLVATGRAAPASLGLDASVNIYPS
jgi:uncharacterized protein (TIGR03083 family)